MNEQEKEQGRYPRYCWCEEASGFLGETLRRMGPPKEARQRFDLARVEFLKGIRSLIDARIQRMEAAAQAPKGSSIPVD
jgi:hypothetical protein